MSKSSSMERHTIWRISVSSNYIHNTLFVHIYSRNFPQKEVLIFAEIIHPFLTSLYVKNRIVAVKNVLNFFFKMSFSKDFIHDANWLQLNLLKCTMHKLCYIMYCFSN